MADEQELQAMVVSFLQAELQKKPTGFSLADFERMFPEATDESATWYTRYKKKNTLEALQSIKSGVKVYTRYNTTWVSLDRNSDIVDDHLIDLITHQKDSRKKARPSSRAVSSFSLNKHYGGRSGGSNDNYRSYPHRAPVPVFKSQSGPSYSSYSNNSRPPRNSNNHQNMIPPHVQMKTYPPAKPQHTHTPTYTRQPLPPPPPPAAKSAPSHQPPSLSSPSSATRPSPLSSRPPTIQQQAPVQPPPKSVPERIVTSRPVAQENRSVPEVDYGLMARKEQLRQKLVHLLTCKHKEINVLHLSALFKLQFEENLIPADYGHRAITELIQDPIIGANIKFVFKSPFPTIRARSLSPLNERQNVDPLGDNNYDSAPTKRYTSAECFEIQASLLSPAKQKLDAIDIFNVRTMLQNLESIPV